MRNVLYTTGGEHGLTWSLWQKTLRETQDQPLGSWSWGYKGPKADYILNAKEILATWRELKLLQE